MRRTALIFLLILIHVTVSGEKIATFEETFKSPQIKTDGKYFFIYNGAYYKFHIYDSKDFSQIAQFGKRGEGPGEFKYNIRFYVLKDTLLVSSVGKISYFTYKGILMKEKKTHINSPSIKPVGDNFICQVFDVPPKGSIATIIYRLVDLKFSPLRDIHKIKSKVIRIYPGAPKQDMEMIPAYPVCEVINGNIIIGNPEANNDLIIYNLKGQKMNTISFKYQPRKVTQTDKDQITATYRKRIGKYWDEIKKTRNFVYPEYYPPYDSFRVYNSKIYLFTHLKKDGKKELFVLNDDGTLLKHCFVPPDRPFTFHKGKMYYLKDNDVEEVWELHREKIY